MQGHSRRLCHTLPKVCEDHHESHMHRNKIQNEIWNGRFSWKKVLYESITQHDNNYIFTGDDLFSYCGAISTILKVQWCSDWNHWLGSLSMAKLKMEMLNGELYNYAINNWSTVFPFSLIWTILHFILSTCNFCSLSWIWGNRFLVELPLVCLVDRYFNRFVLPLCLSYTITNKDMYFSYSGKTTEFS